MESRERRRAAAGGEFGEAAVEAGRRRGRRGGGGGVVGQGLGGVRECCRRSRRRWPAWLMRGFTFAGFTSRLHRFASKDLELARTVALRPPPRPPRPRPSPTPPPAAILSSLAPVLSRISSFVLLGPFVLPSFRPSPLVPDPRPPPPMSTAYIHRLSPPSCLPPMPSASVSMALDSASLIHRSSIVSATAPCLGTGFSPLDSLLVGGRPLFWSVGSHVSREEEAVRQRRERERASCMHAVVVAIADHLTVEISPSCSCAASVQRSSLLLVSVGSFRVLSLPFASFAFASSSLLLPAPWLHL